MSNFCIYLNLPSYLRQWFIHRHGGNDPVNLIKGSIESKLLQRVVVPLPKDKAPQTRQEGDVAICIPFSKSADPRSRNYITDTGKRALAERIKDDFDLDVWDFLHDFGKITKQQKDLIYLFMEQRGIQEDGSCWDAIAKNYQRMRNRYMAQQWHNSHKEEYAQRRKNKKKKI